MKKENKIIKVYSDDLYEYVNENKQRIYEYLRENDIDAQPNNIEDAGAELLQYDYEYMQECINKIDLGAHSKILVVFSLGLWNGTRNGSAYCDTLAEAIFRGAYDINEIYFKNKNCTLSMNAYHHDGVNNYKFYKIVNGRKRAIKYNEFFNL